MAVHGTDAPKIPLIRGGKACSGLPWAEESIDILPLYLSRYYLDVRVVDMLKNFISGGGTLLTPGVFRNSTLSREATLLLEIFHGRALVHQILKHFGPARPGPFNIHSPRPGPDQRSTTTREKDLYVMRRSYLILAMPGGLTV